MKYELNMFVCIKDTRKHEEMTKRKLWLKYVLRLVTKFSPSLKSFVFYFVLLMPLMVEAKVEQQKLQELLNRSETSLRSMLSDRGFSALPKVLEKAKGGVLIIPSLVKGGFIIGGSNGSGVLFARDDVHDWKGPCFVNLTSLSAGLQIGVENSEVVLVIMNKRALKMLVEKRVSFGAGVSVAVGPVGGGIAAETTLNFDSDTYVFSRSKGLFAGGAINGSAIVSMGDWNKLYYDCPDSSLKNIVFGSGCRARVPMSLSGLLELLNRHGNTGSQGISRAPYMHSMRPSLPAASQPVDFKNAPVNPHTGKPKPVNPTQFTSEVTDKPIPLTPSRDGSSSGYEEEDMDIQVEELL